MKLLLIILICAITIVTNAQEDKLKTVNKTWNLDYLKDYVFIYKFEIRNSEKRITNKIYTIENNTSASGEVKGNINLVRHILPREEKLDVSKYNFLTFKIKNSKPVEIVVMQDDNRKWNNRLRYKIAINNKEKEYHIRFIDFKDAKGNKVEVNNIKTIVFSIIGDYTNYKPFSIDINELSFSANNILYDHYTDIKKHSKLKNYPNPFSRSTTIQLPNTSQNIQIRVFDYLGRVVDFQNIMASNPSKKFKYSTPQLKKGIYKYSIKDDKNKFHSGTFVVN